MFTAIGRFAATRARGILVVALLALIGAGAVGFTVFGKLKPEGFADPAAESSQVQDVVNDEFGGQVDVVAMVSAKSGTVDDDAVRDGATDLADRIADDPAVTEALSYWGTGASSLKSDDGRHGLIAVKLEHDDITATEEFAERYADASTDAYDVHFGGPKMMSVDSRTQVGKDLALAEGIAVPIILVLLVFAFGSLVAASLPLLIGAATVFGTFAALSGIASATDVSIYSINLTTALSLGLAVDYALLMVSRFREELISGRSVEDAVVRTVQTAGRTIVFSALTVAVALAVLTVFPLFFLRSFAYSGIGVVLIAMVTSVVVLPALLKVLGYRVNAGRLPWFKKTPSAVSPFWRRVASAVTSRPILCALPVIAILVVGALPVLKAEFGTPDDRVLPSSAQTRTVGDTIREHFPDDNSRAIQVVVEGTISAQQVTDYATTLSQLPDVARVESSAGIFADGTNQGVPPTAAAMGKPGVQRLAVITAGTRAHHPRRRGTRGHRAAGRWFRRGAGRQQARHRQQAPARRRADRAVHVHPAVPVHRQRPAADQGTGVQRARTVRDDRRAGADLPGGLAVRLPRLHADAAGHQHADAVLLHRLRVVHGLRGVRAQPHQGGARPRPRPAGRGGRRALAHRSHRVHGRGADRGELLRLRHRRGELPADVRHRRGTRDHGRRHADPRGAGPGRHAVARQGGLVGAETVAGAARPDRAVRVRVRLRAAGATRAAHGNSSAARERGRARLIR
jgi:hypothetical protein